MATPILRREIRKRYGLLAGCVALSDHGLTPVPPVAVRASHELGLESSERSTVIPCALC
jgi:hypothetical protein